LLDQPAEKQFKTQPLGPEAESGCVARGYVQFNSVSYRYPGQSVFALREFNLVMQPGESVVIYGPSGAGKSTLFHLLAKFATPESGEILLDDKPIDTWDLHSLRANISLVSQHVMLFDGTIKENVAMGNPNASLDEIIQACRAANAWEFIERLPDGLNTPLGVLGNALSGGQRQRIAIARAFLKDSTILLLDEPTSALDRESEGVVLEGLQALIRGRTTLIVSHSPERLLKVDRFIRLDSGSNT
jgi:ABC-type multidrug transport system fused ATPase/permease subunit